jgi:hypothetical protein
MGLLLLSLLLLAVEGRAATSTSTSIGVDLDSRRRTGPPAAWMADCGQVSACCLPQHGWEWTLSRPIPRPLFWARHCWLTNTTLPHTTYTPNQILSTSPETAAAGPTGDDALSTVCGRLWARAVAHQHHHELLPSQMLRGDSRGSSGSSRSSNSGGIGEQDGRAADTTIPAIPQEQQQQQHTKKPRKKKPFFGPWHDDNGDSEGMGPLGTSGEFATFKVRMYCMYARVVGCGCIINSFSDSFIQLPDWTSVRPSIPSTLLRPLTYLNPSITIHPKTKSKNKKQKQKTKTRLDLLTVHHPLSSIQSTLLHSLTYH